MAAVPDERAVTDQVDSRFHGTASATAPRIQAGGHPCQGLYWTPKGDPNPRTAFIATHYNVDFSEHYLAPYLASRGYGFLGWNTRFRGFEDLFLLEHALIDIGEGTKYLHGQGVERIVILGNSGGGSLMGAYQAEATAPTFAAEPDAAPAAKTDAAGFVGTTQLTPAARDALGSLIAGDLYVALNAHAGRPQVLTNWMDASVVDETDPTKTDESLNPFNPANGPPYSPAFVERYRAAQVARNHRITAWAKAELARLNAAGIPDRIFPVYRTWGDLRTMDPAIEPTDRKPRWNYRGDPAQVNKLPGIGRVNTLRTWLSMWSLSDSKCNGEEQLARFTNPAIVIQGMADAGVYPSDSHILHDALGAADKQLHFVKGGHYFEDSVEERHAVADLIADWVEQH